MRLWSVSLQLVCCEGFPNSNSNSNHRPTLINMASYPEGYDLGKEQAVLAVCSTQVWGMGGVEGREC